MEFKKGDKIRLISAKDEDEYYNKYIGKIFTVASTSRDYVRTNEDENINPYKYNIVKVYVLNEYDFKNAPIGTKITYKNGDVLIKDGHNSYENERIARETNNMVRENIIKIEEPQYNTIYIRRFKYKIRRNKLC